MSTLRPQGFKFGEGSSVVPQNNTTQMGGLFNENALALRTGAKDVTQSLAPRRALGNITNQKDRPAGLQGHKTPSAKPQALSGLFHDGPSVDGPSTSSAFGSAVQSRAEALAAEGIEQSAGMPWERQEAERESRFHAELTARVRAVIDTVRQSAAYSTPAAGPRLSPQELAEVESILMNLEDGIIPEVPLPATAAALAAREPREEEEAFSELDLSFELPEPMHHTTSTFYSYRV